MRKRIVERVVVEGGREGRRVSGRRRRVRARVARFWGGETLGLVRYFWVDVMGMMGNVWVEKGLGG